MTIMLDEIKQEPEAIKQTYWKEARSVQFASEMISKSSMVYVSGSGTSFHASTFLSMLLIKAGHPSCAIQASNYDEFLIDRIPEKSVNIIFSQSGESTDALANLTLSRRKKISVIGITNEVNSTLAKNSDICIVTRAGTERSVAATKSHSVQLVSAILIYHEITGKDPEKLINSAINGISRLIANGDEINRISNDLSNHVVFLGSGLDYTVAMEGDLKFKETSGIYTESYVTREYLHGPIHRLDRETSVVILQGDKEKDASVINRIEKIAGNPLLIGSSHGDIEVQEMDMLERPLVYLTAVQMLANFKTVALGQDPDHPSNLTKVVKE